jgi:hypothetical protein
VKRRRNRNKGERQQDHPRSDQHPWRPSTGLPGTFAFY